jgi:hypothetical protein
MKKIRKRLSVLLPAIILIMIAGLILSRVYRPEHAPAPPRTTSTDVPERSASSPAPDQAPAPAQALQPEIRIESTEAERHAGRIAEVCGLVTGAEYVVSVGGEPTFLNFGDPYPGHHFTVVIWGENLGRWNAPPHQLYLNRRICVTGTIRMHRGKPQIVAEHPGQIRLPGS